MDSWMSLMRTPENLERVARRSAARSLGIAGVRGGTLAMITFGLASLVV